MSIPFGVRRRGPGFAGMSEHRLKDVSSKGGRTAHARGTAHEFTSEEARVAGAKGGQAKRRAANEIEWPVPPALPAAPDTDRGNEASS